MRLDILALLILWIGVGFVAYFIYSLEKEDEKFMKDWPRWKRIVFRLGIIFLWPIWVPGVVLLCGTAIIYGTIKSIFE